jgi:hypothetical protein
MGLFFFLPPLQKALRLSYKNMKIIAQRLPKYHVRGAHSAATTLFLISITLSQFLPYNRYLSTAQSIDH